MTLPLLSVITGEYFSSVGKGKTKLRIKKASKIDAMLTPILLNIFLRLDDGEGMEKDFIFHASLTESKIAGMLVQV